MLFLEVSLVAFLLQGNNAGGLEAMKRTFGISTLVVGLDILLKVFLWFFPKCKIVTLVKSCYHNGDNKTHQCSIPCQINLFFHAKYTVE